MVKVTFNENTNFFSVGKLETARLKMSMEQSVDNCSVTYEQKISHCNSPVSIIPAFKKKKVYMGQLRQFGKGATSAGDGVAPSL